MIISGTYFGSKQEYDALDIHARFFHRNTHHVTVLNGWPAYIGHLADEASLLLGTGNPTPIYCKSLAFRKDTLLPETTIDQLFQYFDLSRKGSPLLFVYFDLEGGAVNDVPVHDTAYAHRDALMYTQAYVVGLDFGSVSKTSKSFILGVADVVKHGMPDVDFGVYAGYVDPELREGEAQKAYWDTNLPQLEKLKQLYDADDVFITLRA
jgi:hypothetical protein